MRRFFTKGLLSMLLLFIASMVNAAVSITSQGGWFESAYVEFTPDGSSYYNAYYSTDKSNWTKVDDQLVRKYSSSKGRADVIGIKAGTYYIKVESVSSSGAIVGSTVSGALTVKAHDRGGFAHKDWSKGVGAYDNNGVLKSGARVLYVASSNAKTVKLKMKTSSSAETEFTGLQAILGAYEKGYETRPLAIRIIGTLKITDLDSYSSSEEGIQIKGKGYTDLPLTIEGVGNDAVIHGFGMLIRGFSDLELRNFAVMNCLDDCISLDTKNSHVWVHNLDLFYGQTGSAADQKKGDGTIDLKGDSQYITISYNHFWDSGKCSLCGMKSESGPNYITYHHNWFDHSDSRHPRIRTMSVHFYNNYLDGNAKYGIGTTMGASCFAENNYFRNCKYPMMRSLEGTDAKGDGTFSGEAKGYIKAYGNIINGASSFIASTNSATSGITETITSREASYDAVVVNSKSTTLSDGYHNFDTNSSLMYSYTADAASAVPDIVKGTYGAGRLQHGNYSFTFSSSEDTNSAVVDALKSDVTNFPTNSASFNATSSSFFKADALGAETETGSGDSGNTGSGDSGNTGGGDSGNTGGGETGGGSGSVVAGGDLCVFTGNIPSMSSVTVTGNYSNSKGTMTINGTEYSICVKMESSTKINFTLASATDVTFYFGGSTAAGGQKFKIDGTSKTLDSNGTLTVNLAAGTHEITKDSGINLFAIGFGSGSETGGGETGGGSGSSDPVLSTACDVLSASVEDIPATINGTDITVTIPYAADAATANLVAEFKLSDKISAVTKTDGTAIGGTLTGSTWTILKSLTAAPGSTNSQSFTVVAEDGTTKKSYKLVMTRGENNTAPVTYTVSGSAYPTAGGTVAVSKSTANAGETVTFTATPNSGYKFKQWDDESTANPYNKVINENTALIATFTALNTDATLSNIRINGNNLATFATGTTSYTYELPYGTTAVPTVSATATNSGAIVTVTQATATNGTASIKVTAESGATKTYTIQFSVAQNASSEATGDQSQVEYKGWFEAAYVKFPKGSYPSYNVYISPASSSTWTKLDEELIREYATYVRADAVGLKAGSYKFKIVPVSNSSAEVEKDAIITDNFTVTAHDRSGFAHSNRNGVGIGAYNNDGTLKANARVLYVTADNAKTVKCNVMGDKDVEYTGLQAIIAAYEKGKETRPLDIRFIGTVKKENLDAIGSSAEGLQVKGKIGTDMNITLEGIGEDAAVHGFGFLVRNAQSVEFRNFAVMICLDDCISLDTENHHCWVHNMDFFYGGTGSDADQAKGDGTVDIKGKSSHNTVSYNHFYDAGKCSLGGMKSETTDCYMTYHHNWFDHSDSRHPRIRTAFYHVYNNYFDGVAKYGTGVTMGGSAFVEQNYFRNTKYPMLISLQGTDAEGDGTFSGEAGGVIKAYRNVMVNPKKIQFYDGSQTDGKWDAVLVQERNATVSATAFSGGTGYNNTADAAARSQYIENKIDDPDNIPTIVQSWLGAGRMGHGDFTWTFSNSAQDENYGVVSDLKTSLLSYTSTLVGFYGGAKISNGGATSAVNAGDGKGLTAEQQNYTPSWGASYYPASYQLGDDTGSTTGGGSSAAGVPYIYSGTTEAPAYYWFNSSNDTKTQGYISGNVITLSTGTAAATYNASNQPAASSDGTVSTDKVGNIALAKSGGYATFYCADGFTSAKFYLYRAGTYVGTIEGSADGTNFTSLFSLSSSKGDYEPSVNVTSGTKYIRINNTATGTLYVQGVLLYSEKASQGGTDIGSDDGDDTGEVDSPIVSNDATAMVTVDGAIMSGTSQTITLEASDTKGAIAVTVSPNDAAASISNVTNANGSAGSYSITVPAAGNSVTATFTVKAESNATQTYTITVTKKAAQQGEVATGESELLIFPNNNTFYTVTGNTSTTKGTATVDGVQYGTCLKMESSTSVTFTTTKDASMKLVMGAAGSTIKVDGSSWTADNNGIIEIENLSAGAHTITKDGSYNLFYGKLTYASETTGGGDPEPGDGKLNLTDAAEYKAGTYAAGDVTYTRSNTVAGNYGSFCLPFDFDTNEAAGIAKFYVPVNIAVYNTTTNKLKLFLAVEKGTIKAGTPFIALFNGATSMTNNVPVTFYSSIDNPESINMDVFDSNGNDGALLESENVHVSWNGTYNKINKIDGMMSFNSKGDFAYHTGTTLNAFRAYLIVTSDTQDTNSIQIELTFGDEETDVEGIIANTINKTVDVYTTNGILVRKAVEASRALEGLANGMYIINKKVIIK